MTNLDQKLAIVDELSKAYQRIVSVNNNKESQFDAGEETTSIILKKISDVVEDINKI